MNDVTAAMALEQFKRLPSFMEEANLKIEFVKRKMEQKAKEAAAEK